MHYKEYGPLLSDEQKKNLIKCAVTYKDEKSKLVYGMKQNGLTPTQTRIRILEHKARTAQLLLNAKIYSPLNADDTKNRENASMAWYLYATCESATKQSIINYARHHPVSSQFPQIIAAEMLDYSLPDIEQYAMRYQRANQQVEYPVSFLIDLLCSSDENPYLEKPLVAIYLNYDATLDDIKKEIRIRSLLEFNVCLPQKIKIMSYDNHVKDSTTLASYLTVASSPRKRFQLIPDEE